MKFFIITLLVFSLSLQVNAVEDLVATVLLTKGNVQAKLHDGSTISLKVEQKIPIGAIVQTSANSFVKLIFIDKSQITLGPSGEVLIQAFPRNEAGIIKLLSGQLRSEVTKNYMEIQDKAKSKLFIHTRTASMGIRGTDFQVNYNPKNENSSLIVFEGKVAMGNIDRSMRDSTLDQKILESIVSNSTAVLVKQGQFSAVNLNIGERPLLPTKLAPKQFEALKENSTGIDEPSASRGNLKQKRNIIPPSVDSAIFTNTPPEVVKAEIKEAKGFYNPKSGEYKPASGSFIDLKTVNLIPPATGSRYDVATKTFSIPQNYGKVNERSGQYIAPTGYELSNNGKFQITTSHIDSSEERSPSRIETNNSKNGERRDTNNETNISTPSPAPGAVILPPQVINNIREVPLPRQPIPNVPLEKKKVPHHH
jgi:hypothetical protein